MSKKSDDLWADSDSDSSTGEKSTENCCLICSILPSLTEKNCCSKHLTALSKNTVYTHHRFRQNWEKLRPLTLTSFSKNDRLLSPNKLQINHLSKPTMNKRKRRSNSPIASSSDQIESNCLTPRILLKRVIYVKDDDEEQDESIETNSQIILNMSQATKQMTNEILSQPRILLKRVRLEQ